MAAVPSSLEPMKLGSGYNTPWWATAAKWGLLAIAGLFAAYVIQKLISSGSWLGVVITAFIAMCFLAVYGTRRAVPMKYLLPGLVLLVTLQIWPIVYTVATAFTNYGQGHTLSKQDATDRNLANSVKEVEGTERYKLSIAVPEGTDVTTGAITFLLTKPDGSMFVGTARAWSRSPRTASRRPTRARSPRRRATPSSTPARPTSAARTSTPSPCRSTKQRRHQVGRHQQRLRRRTHVEVRRGRRHRDRHGQERRSTAPRTPTGRRPMARPWPPAGKRMSAPRTSPTC
jgi:hypothetical protein